MHCPYGHTCKFKHVALGRAPEPTAEHDLVSDDRRAGIPCGLTKASQTAYSSNVDLQGYSFPPRPVATTPGTVTLQHTLVQQTTLRESVLHPPQQALNRRTSAPDVSYRNQPFASPRPQFQPFSSASYLSPLRQRSTPAFSPPPAPPSSYRSPDARPPPLDLAAPFDPDPTMPDMDLWSPCRTGSSTRSSFTIATPRKGSQPNFAWADKGMQDVRTDAEGFPFEL